jgi:hypothetical protein
MPVRHLQEQVPFALQAAARCLACPASSAQQAPACTLEPSHACRRRPQDDLQASAGVARERLLMLCAVALQCFADGDRPPGLAPSARGLGDRRK